jgi:putative hemolysin
MSIQKTMLGVAVVVLAVVGVLFVVRLFSGNEDTWLCQNGQWVKHGNPSAAMPSTGCGESADQLNGTGLANPASVNCEEKGGRVDIRTDSTGGQYGVCVFDGGKECEEWAMFRGECPVGGLPAKETSLTKPASGDLTMSPLEVEGTMPGNWYFEAVAGVEILDANGKILGTAQAQAQTDWMTTGTVNFKSTVPFVYPSTATGTLVLNNDNPSGLPENSRSESYPIIFGTKVKVYFSNSEKNPGALDCSKVFAVERIVPKTQDIARAALGELLKGASENDKSEKYFTSINDGVVIQKLTIANGTARVDFDKAIEYQLGGSCRVSAIRAQIEETLKQFPTVKEVVISVDGRTDDILQP